MCYFKNILVLLISFYCTLFYSQTAKKDKLLGEFTYLLRAKLNTVNHDEISHELFTLQISESKAIFINENSIKFDSIFQNEFQKIAGNESKNKDSDKIIDFRGKSFPKTKFPYTIIQFPANVQYFENVAMILLSYKEPVIKDWKLLNDSEAIINTFNCKKAEITYKGRKWIAWYSTEVPFPYGPYKFSGLPGLIIKISDEKGDYEFEVVKSSSTSQLDGKFININKSRYTKATETTSTELEKARKNFSDNLLQRFESMGTVFKPEQRESLRKRQIEGQLNKNSIELDN